jgi:hypothetical protein
LSTAPTLIRLENEAKKSPSTDYGTKEIRQ